MDLKKLKADFLEELKNVKNEEGLESLVLKYFGRKQGIITDLLKGIKDMPAEKKQTFGKDLNVLKNELTNALNLKKVEITGDEDEDFFDYTLDLPKRKWEGSIHPFNIVQKETMDIFLKMGFEVIDSNEMDNVYNTFDALNFAKDHPSRDMMDTFYLEGEENEFLLRPHTSSFQNRALKSRVGNYPIRLCIPGFCFRNEKIDTKHDVFFYQTEGIFVDKGVTMGHLLWTLKTFVKELFGREMKMRIRPNFFPFVEPGIEIDLWYEDKETGKSQWLEILGAGMIHNEVLKEAGIDPTIYSGFAFGLGSRFAMLKYKSGDFRSFISNDIRFLSQFKV